MSDLFPITKADKLACIEREIRKREDVYPRLIQQGSMSFDRAEREIALMRAIREDYRKE